MQALQPPDAGDGLAASGRLAYPIVMWTGPFGLRSRASAKAEAILMLRYSAFRALVLLCSCKGQSAVRKNNIKHNDEGLHRNPTNRTFHTFLTIDGFIG